MKLSDEYLEKVKEILKIMEESGKLGYFKIEDPPVLNEASS